MRQGKVGSTFDSDDAVLSHPSNDLINSGILGDTRKTRISLTNTNMGSQQPTKTPHGETYGSIREITVSSLDNRRDSNAEVHHLHDTHHTTMYGSQVPIHHSPTTSSHHGSSFSPGTPSPGSRRASKQHPSSHSDSRGSSFHASGLLGRNARGSFLGVLDKDNNEEDEDVYEIDASLEEEIFKEKEELAHQVYHSHSHLLNHH